MTRDELERLQDRPSLHSYSPTERALGRCFAIMDQHIADHHPEVAMMCWTDFRCSICSFDVRLEYQRLYPGE